MVTKLLINILVYLKYQLLDINYQMYDFAHYIVIWTKTEGKHIYDLWLVDHQPLGLQD